MTLDVTTALRSPGESFPFRHEEVLSPQEVLGEEIRFDEPVVLEGTYTMVDDALLLRGTLYAKAHASCAKCLEPVVHPIAVGIDESLLRTQSAMPEDGAEAWDEQFSFSGSKVEMNPLALTLTMLVLPIRFLCGKGCQGMPEGAAGDDEQDSQKDLPQAHPFSALQQLLTKDQEV